MNAKQNNTAYRRGEELRDLQENTKLDNMQVLPIVAVARSSAEETEQPSVNVTEQKRHRLFIVYHLALSGYTRHQAFIYVNNGGSDIAKPLPEFIWGIKYLAFSRLWQEAQQLMLENVEKDRDKLYAESVSAWRNFIRISIEMKDLNNAIKSRQSLDTIQGLVEQKINIVTNQDEVSRLSDEELTVLTSEINEKYKHTPNVNKKLSHDFGDKDITILENAKERAKKRKSK